MDNPKTTMNTPSHLPKINPAKIANGDPNPAAKTQIIVNKINKKANKNKFVCLS